MHQKQYSEGNAFRLVKNQLGCPQMRDESVVWCYDRLKPVLRAGLGEGPFTTSYWNGLPGM